MKTLRDVIKRFFPLCGNNPSLHEEMEDFTDDYRKATYMLDEVLSICDPSYYGENAKEDSPNFIFIIQPIKEGMFANALTEPYVTVNWGDGRYKFPMFLLDVVDFAEAGKLWRHTNKIQFLKSEIERLTKELHDEYEFRIWEISQ